MTLRRTCTFLLFLGFSGTFTTSLAAQDEHEPRFPGKGRDAIDVLHTFFPEQAPRVLGAKQGTRFVKQRDGFVAVSGSDALRIARSAGVRTAAREWTAPECEGFCAIFPRKGSEPVRFSLAGDFAFEVRELGAKGSARTERGAIVYQRDDGFAFWSSYDDRFEEWLLLETPWNGAVVEWEIFGTVLEAHETDAHVLDAQGAGRIAIAAHQAYGASGAEISVRLEVKRTRLRLVLGPEASREGYVLIHLGWAPVGSLASTRVGGTATLLTDGTVIAVGGFGSQGSPTNYATRYDPATGQWSSMTPPNQFHAYHTATLLHDGTVLVVAGFDGNVQKQNTAEIYDPRTDSWSSAGTLSVARVRHTATLLRDKRVLVVGGEVTSGSTASSQIYDPATQTWSTADSLLFPRHSHTATRLRDGRVLVVGGRESTFTEIYNPTTDTWSPAGFTNTIHFIGHTATLLRDGRVLVAAGYGVGGTPNKIADCEIYNPVNGTFSSTGGLNIPRGGHVATLLPNGDVLVAGGGTPASINSPSHRQTHIYNPSSGTWTVNFYSLNHARLNPAATLLPSGDVLLVGGFWNPAAPKVAEVLHTVVTDWAGVGPMTEKRRHHSATRLPDGRVRVVGGLDDMSQVLATAELYDPVAGTFQATGSLANARQRHTATLLASGQVLVTGGATDAAETTFEASTELYDPATGTWSTTATLLEARGSHTATLLPDGNVLVAGGQDAMSALQSLEVYELATPTWSPALGSLNIGRAGHTATLLLNDRVLFVGGNAGYATAELYNPAGGTSVGTSPQTSALTLDTL